MTHYYNEFDAKTAAWLRELMAQGLIPSGVIDERSIKDVAAVDVAGDGQRHFFTGIGGWCEALRLANWGERSVWTGSCPCQPYSTAGKRKGNADDRDLWPDFYRLIRECRPDTVFGEQVPGAIKHGWLDRVHADLEREGYAVGHCVLGAHSVGSPHIRQRLYWVASRNRPTPSDGLANAESTRGRADFGAVRSGTPAWLRDAEREDERRSCICSGRACDCGTVDGLANASGTKCQRRAEPTGQYRGALHATNSGSSRRLVNSECNGVGRNGGTAFRAESQSDRSGVEDGASGEQPAMSGAVGGVGQSNGSGWRTGDESTQTDGHGRAVVAASSGAWSDYRIIQCRDGKARRIPTQRELFPLAHGIPSRVVQLRGYGNAIVPQVAAVFIKAFLETKGW